MRYRFGLVNVIMLVVGVFIGVLVGIVIFMFECLVLGCLL